MKKLILGIVAVFCVQITFQIFVAIDGADADHRARIDAGPLVAPVIEDKPALEVAELSDMDDIGQTDIASAERPTFHRSMSPNVSPQTAAFDRGVRRISNTTRFGSMVAIVQTTPRLDLAAPTVSRDQRDAHLVTKEVSRAHKRSFFAKLLPVVKKPYDLLKMVASNLK